MPMLYRSPLTRLILSATGVSVGFVMIFGDQGKWRSAPSLSWLAQAVPLRLAGAVFVAYGLLLISRRTRPLGFAVGAVLFGVFTFSLFATLDLGSDEPKNAIVLAAMLDVTVFHAYSIRNAWYVREMQ